MFSRLTQQTDRWTDRQTDSQIDRLWTHDWKYRAMQSVVRLKMELVNPRTCDNDMSVAVRQQTGHSQNVKVIDSITVESLGQHYTQTSTDTTYQRTLRNTYCFISWHGRYCIVAIIFDTWQTPIYSNWFGQLAGLVSPFRPITEFPANFHYFHPPHRPLYDIRTYHRQGIPLSRYSGSSHLIVLQRPICFPPCRFDHCCPNSYPAVNNCSQTHML